MQFQKWTFSFFPTWILCLSLLLLLACKKQDRRDDLYRNGWSEMDSISDRSFFPPNITTWIYEDSLSGEIDTVTLVQLYIDTTDVYYTDYPDILHYTKVEKTIGLYSSKFNSTIYYSSILGDPFTSSFSIIDKSANLGGYQFAKAPLSLKLTHKTLHGLSGVVNYHSGYSQNGTTYMNVAEIEHLGETSHNGAHTRYFFSPNYGLIKFVNYHQNQVWELVLCF